MYRQEDRQQQPPPPDGRNKRARHKHRQTAGIAVPSSNSSNNNEYVSQPSHDPHQAGHAVVPNPHQQASGEEGSSPVTPVLSNTQLKKLRVKEWREKRKLGLPDVDDPATGGNQFAPAVSPSATDFSAALTKQLAIDCEMVGAGPRGCRDMLARVSIVNAFGALVYDKYVQPIEPVTDYRSFVSGIYPQHLAEWGVSFAVVQREVCDLLKDRIIVGHAIKHDLRVLYLQHPTSDIRDTSLYFDAAVYGGRGTPSLRKLTEHYVGVAIQSRAHDSVEDARATMRLYALFRREWEAKLADGRVPH